MSCDYCTEHNKPDCEGVRLVCTECRITFCDYSEYYSDPDHPLEFSADCSCCHYDFCSNCIKNVLEKQGNKCSYCLHECKKPCHAGCDGCDCEHEDEEESSENSLINDISSLFKTKPNRIWTEEDPNKIFVAIPDDHDWYRNCCILRDYYFDYQKCEQLNLEFDCERYGVYVFWKKSSVLK